MRENIWGSHRKQSGCISKGLPEYPYKHCGSRQGANTYDPILFFFTCLSTLVKTGALSMGLTHMILSYSSLPARVPLQKLGLQARVYAKDLILFFVTCPSTPAKTGALGRGLTHMILSYFFLTCPSTPATTLALGRGLLQMILSSSLPAQTLCKN